MQTALTGERPPQPQMNSSRVSPSASREVKGTPQGAQNLEAIENAILQFENTADTLRAVCAHVTANEGAESSRALASLIRALYLDASAFTFEALDCLGPATRRQAERLISARLWGTCLEEEWQKAFDAVCAYEFKERSSSLAGSPAGSRLWSPPPAPEISKFNGHLADGGGSMRANTLEAQSRQLSSLQQPTTVEDAATEPQTVPSAKGRMRGEWIVRLIVLVLFLAMVAALGVHMT
jgi:hypothetical protein